jgi:hypothetical protein
MDQPMVSIRYAVYRNGLLTDEQGNNGPPVSEHAGAQFDFVRVPSQLMRLHGRPRENA